MISETTLLECENVPQEMAKRFDQPWFQIGTVPTGNLPCIREICQKCIDKQALTYAPIPISSYRGVTFHTVDMRGYLFITDDMIEVMVYFGVCQDCDSVYWARSGPPFQRARAYKPSVAR